MRQKIKLSRLTTVFKGNPIQVLMKYLGLSMLTKRAIPVPFGMILLSDCNYITYLKRSIFLHPASQAILSKGY